MGTTHYLLLITHYSVFAPFFTERPYHPQLFERRKDYFLWKTRGMRHECAIFLRFIFGIPISMVWIRVEPRITKVSGNTTILGQISVFRVELASNKFNTKDFERLRQYNHLPIPLLFLLPYPLESIRCIYCLDK